MRALLASLSTSVDAMERNGLEPTGGTRSQPDDEAIEESALVSDLGLLAAEDELGYEVRDALERIEQGSFGVCETCGEWIRRQRLAIVPYARDCASCAREKEAARRRA